MPEPSSLGLETGPNGLRVRLVAFFGVLHQAAMSTSSLLPDDSGLEPVHTRRYETRVYRLSDEELLVRAAVSDTKPPGLYIQGDPDELEIHQMQLELRVAYPSS